MSKHLKKDIDRRHGRLQIRTLANFLSYIRRCLKMAAPKPTILLVTGAFTTEACYDRLLPYLHKAGYPTAVTALPSASPENPDSCSIAKDGQHVMQKHLLPLLHEGKDVVVYAHSLGATCLGGATEAVAKSDRVAEGKSGGVLGFVYMSFAFVTEGQSQLEFLGGAWPPFCKVDVVSAVHF